MRATLEVNEVAETEIMEGGTFVEAGTIISPASEPGPSVVIDIPLAGLEPYTAAIYLREIVPDATDEPLDSNGGSTFEALGFWKSEQVFTNVGTPTARLFAIGDAGKAISVAACKSKKQADKRTAAAIMSWVEKMDEADVDGPAGEPCEWPGGEQREELACEVPGNEVDVPPGHHRAPGGLVRDGECPHCDSVPSYDGPTVPAPPAPSGLAVEGEGSGVTGEPAPSIEPPAATSPNDHFTFRFQESMAELATATLDYVDCKARYKLAESRFKLAIDGLKAVADKGMERFPLFDRPAVSIPTANPDHPSPPRASERSEPAPPASESTATEQWPPAPPSDAWRATSIDELGLPPKLAAKLREDANVSTIGALEDLRGSFDGLRGVKGIGPKKVDQIENAVIDWLTKNRREDVEAFAAVAGQSADTEQPTAVGPTTPAPPASDNGGVGEGETKTTATTETAAVEVTP